MEVSKISVERIWFLNVSGNLLDESKIFRATIRWRKLRSRTGKEGKTFASVS